VLCGLSFAAPARRLYPAENRARSNLPKAVVDAKVDGRRLFDLSSLDQAASSQKW
jgi:hypothetical protein